MDISPTMATPQQAAIRAPELGVTEHLEHQPTPEELEMAEQRKKKLEWSSAKSPLDALIKQFAIEQKETEIRRKVRDLDINVQKLRDDGDIQEDETFIPSRIVDTNIRREKPPYVSYLTQSQRIAIFTSNDNPSEDNRELELAFTKGMTYPRWQTPLLRCLDGCQTHGWDAVEVIFDASKPFKIGVEHIGHENLIFATDSTDIQNNEEILRRYSLTPQKLREYSIRFGFDMAQVKIILDSKSKSNEVDLPLFIYKRFFKLDGVVWVAWFHSESSVTDWLRKPEKYDIGLRHKEQQTIEVPNPLSGQPLMSDNGGIGLSVQVGVQSPTIQQPQEIDVLTPLDSYPIFVQYYDETEKPRIDEHYGRVYLDEFKQEGQSALVTSFVNGCLRASKIYGSPKNQAGVGSNIKPLEVKLSDGQILNQPFEFWHTPFPDPGVLKGVEYMDISNQSETGQVAFAAKNNQDSRKTAKEMQLAESQQQMLTSVQVVLYSIFLRDVWTFTWKVVQNLAMQGIIVVLPPDPVANNANPLATMLPSNDMAKIMKSYDVRPAGDIDFVQRNQTIQMMQQDWAVIAATPLAPIFLANLMRLKYQDKGEAYAKILETAPQRQQISDSLLQQTSGLIMAAMKDGEMAKLPPNEQLQVKQLMQHVQQYLTSAQQQTQQASGGGQQ